MSAKQAINDKLQGSVATYARCGGMFNIHLTANLLRNLPVKKCKSVKIWQNYGHESVVPYFWPTVYASYASGFQVLAVQAVILSWAPD